MTGTWQNWGRIESITPVRVERPATPSDVIASIARARRDGLRVKPIGAGHSFTGIAVSPACSRSRATSSPSPPAPTST
jgi:FAD/FMN-containing dehydrogenase